MLNLSGGMDRTCEGPTRRDFLKVGALGLGGLMLPDLLRLRAAESAAGRTTEDTAVILIWCSGGPTQFETYDPKPDAPAQYRGPLGTIRTRVPGMAIGELLPEHAKVANRFTLVRSLSHDDGGHGSATKNVLTGYKHPARTNEGDILYPTVGSIVNKSREADRRRLPHYVCVPRVNIRGQGFSHSGAAYLGPAYNPYGVDSRRGPEGLTLPVEINTRRLRKRRKLLSTFDTLRRDADESGVMRGMDAFTQQAFEMVTGDAARKAMDLTLESQATRKLYGEKGFGKRGERDWGMRCLMARRLVEAGVSFVTVIFESWDDHGSVEHNMKERGPYFDRAVSGLIQDLYARGLNKRVAVLLWGEFGRTPKMNKRGKKGPGRDHYPGTMSALLSGGGMKVGQVIGSTDARGERPHKRRLHPNDVWASIYQHLGIDPSRTFVNNAGRPIPILPGGKPIAELF